MRQIFVDSRDRISGTSSDFTIQLPSTLVLEGTQQARIDDLRIPQTFPTISSTNNTIQVLMGSTTYTVTIPTAQYDGNGLASAIQSALQAAIPGSWSSVYNANLISMSISCSNPYTFTGGSYMNVLLQRPYTSTINSYNFSYVPVTGADVLYLCSSNFTNLDTVGPNGSHDTLCSVPITCGFGSVQSYNMSNEVWFDCPALTTQQLSFQLRDRSYNILHQVPNISFVLTIDWVFRSFVDQ